MFQTVLIQFIVGTDGKFASCINDTTVLLISVARSRCSTGINKTDGKFATGVFDTGGKIAPGVVDSASKFVTIFVDTGGAP
jgi:hypothetical protein